MTYLLYDGTFEGFLIAVCAGRRFNPPETRILSKRDFEPDLFAGEVRRIESDEHTFARAAAEIIERMSREGLATIQYAFRSERQGIEDDLLAFIRRALVAGEKVLGERHDQAVRNVLEAARRVEHEYHRFLGLLRFEERGGSVMYAALRPDNDIIELLGGHFQARFPRTDWIIHDLGRRSAVIYRGSTLRQSSGQASLTTSGGELVFCPCFDGGTSLPETAEPEKKWQTLWKLYCDIITVPQRRNPKLQRHFLPNKYRETLTEMKEPGGDSL